MFAEKILEILRRYVKEVHGDVTSHASKSLGVPNDTLDKWCKGKRDPQISKIGPILDKILKEYADPNFIGTVEIKFVSENLGSDECKQKIEALQTQLKAAQAEIHKLEGELSGLRKSYESVLDRIFEKEPDDLDQYKNSG